MTLVQIFAYTDDWCRTPLLPHPSSALCLSPLPSLSSFVIPRAFFSVSCLVLPRSLGWGWALSLLYSQGISLLRPVLRWAPTLPRPTGLPKDCSGRGWEPEGSQAAMVTHLPMFWPRPCTVRMLLVASPGPDPGRKNEPLTRNSHKKLIQGPAPLLSPPKSPASPPPHPQPQTHRI